MRTAPLIKEVWESGGPFIGTDAQPHSRVTVQAPWSDLTGDHKYDILRSTYLLGIGNYASRGIPIRWFQDAANDQVEIEVPNIASVNTSRSIDQDAASFDVSIYNQQMYANTAGPVTTDETGQPGYYSFNRGVSLDAQGRWRQAKNAWENLLVPDAIIRTYQGYGGNDLTIAAAVTAGNIILTGVWLVDTVQIGTNGIMVLKGRDAAKLLLDQQLYLPLIPKDKYPLTYYRWIIFNRAVNAATHTVNTTTQTNQPAGDKITDYETSSVDAWYDAIYGHDMLLHGHRPSDAFDGSEETYFLGEGSSGPQKPFAVNFLQATCGEDMNAVYISPWAGNYTMYVSVMENGQWQGDPNNLIYYDPSLLFGTQPYAVNTGSAIPYVASFGIPWETPGEYVLPRTYHADRVRVTFRDLTYTDYGPWKYRAGIREFKIRGSGGTTSNTTSTVIQPVFYAATSILTLNNRNTTGYLTSSDRGQVDAFGDARTFGQTGGDTPSAGVTTGIAFSKTNLGYYTLQEDGRVQAYGDAIFYGSPHNSGVGLGTTADGRFNIFADVIPTFTGLGYWVTRWDGSIYNFGDAPPYAQLSGCGPVEKLARSCGNPNAYGLFNVVSNGQVQVRGTAANYGNWSTPALSFTTPEGASDIQCTSTGLGYWLLSGAGRVQCFGDAVDSGGIPSPTPSTSNYERYYELLPAPDDAGYLIMRGDGSITALGTVQFFGSPVPGGQLQLRKNGNYLDYTDIIKDLALWSGFTLYDPDTPANAQPSVHGNLESTGAFSPEDLPTEIFDKRPVIDAMHAIKEIVGYLLWVDEEGGLRFESPNWWAPGNFDEEGNHTRNLPVLDEKVTLIDYSATVADEPLRSMVIISSLDPDQGAQNGTVTTRLKPSTAKRLRGLIKPAMWVNGYFLRPEEQKIMAELIALHINFQSRVGQVTCVANPCLQINDQVRIFERQTADTYMHYVRGVNTSHDLDKGKYVMTVTTHWLGNEDQWAIQAQGAFVSGNDDDPNISYSITPALADVLRTRFGSAAANQFGNTLTPASTMLTEGTQTGDRAGPDQ